MSDVVAYIAVFGILVSYKIGGKVFDWANIIGCFPLIYNAFLHGNYPSMIISISFGLIGAWRLYAQSA